MKIDTITTTNQKGQIVIPALLRAKLGITDQVPLHITLKGNAIYIVPILGLITTTDGESSYLDILKKTQGTWQGSSISIDSKKEIELESSAKRKNAW